MDVRELKYLLTLAECRNMTRAAEALYISQSALSHYVKNVEKTLGTRLFDRSTTPLSLTPAGRCYMDSARRILMEEERLEKELRDITRHMSGTLCLGIAPDRLSYMIPRLLPRISAAYPGIEVRLLSGSGQSLTEALRRGDCDLVILSDSMEVTRQGLSGEVLYPEEIVLAVHRGSMSDALRDPGNPRVVRPARLAALPLFLLPQGHGSRAFCDGFYRRHRLNPAIRLELPNNIGFYRMAATGMGAAIIPYMTTRLTDLGDSIELFSLGDPPETWNICMLWRDGAYIGQPEQDLIGMAKEIFSSEKLYYK